MLQLAVLPKLLLVVPLAPGVSGDESLALGFWGKSLPQAHPLVLFDK